MKDPVDTVTVELKLAHRRGRPSTGQAMSAAERKREQRRRDREASAHDDYANCTTQRLLRDLGQAVDSGLVDLAKRISMHLLIRCQERDKANMVAARSKNVTVTKFPPAKVQAFADTNGIPPAKSVTVTKKLLPKYRCASTGQTWTGRGKQPAWVMAHIARGGFLADLLL